jgi:hypothetical protein
MNSEHGTEASESDFQGGIVQVDGLLASGGGEPPSGDMGVFLSTAPNRDFSNRPATGFQFVPQLFYFVHKSP